MHIIRQIFIGSLILVSGHSALAQIKGPKYDERLLFRGLSGIALGGVQQEWVLEDATKTKTTLLQQSAPVSVSIPFTNRLLVTVANAPAIAKVDTVDVTGIADTRIGFSYVWPGDKLWINGGASVPTGVTKLKADQFSRIGTIIAQAPLGYRVPVFGQGTNGSFGFAYAYSATRRFVIGFGGSFLYKGKYEPVEPLTVGSSTKSFVTDPGEEVSANVGFDYVTVSKESRLSTDLTVTNYLPDKLNDQKLFQSGIRVMVISVLSQRIGETVHMGQVRIRVRGSNKFFDSTETKSYKSSQHYEAQYLFTWRAAQWFSIGASLEGKYYTGDQIPIGTQPIETGKAEIGSAGAEIGLSLSSFLAISIGGRVGTGNITIDSKKYNLTGTEASGALRVMF